MVQIDITYDGDLHTTARHGPSGASLTTDAPKDNQGRGEAFSPTDLVGAALGSCILTIMGIAARRRGIKLEGTRLQVTKHMASAPVRRIGRLEVVIEMPGGLSAADRTLLENAAYTCPVHKSLHPEIELPMTFRYPD